MKVVFDVEANGLVNPTEVWLVVCMDVSTCHKHIFRNLTRDPDELERFLEFAKGVSCWIGHNILNYDFPVLYRLCNLPQQDVGSVVDTLIISKLVDYPRQGHSIKDYGIEFNLHKGDWTDFSKYSLEMEEYCVRDVEICHRVYLKYLRYISNHLHDRSIRLEHEFQLVVNRLHDRGFCFDAKLASNLLRRVEKELSVLDKDILEAFPPRLKLLREITPKGTKYGTISLSSIPKDMRNDTMSLSVGSAFSYCVWTAFNPASHKQIISILNEAKWSPVDKTKAHIDAERKLNSLKRQRRSSKELDLEIHSCRMVLDKLRFTGWKVNENNISTLPASAPAPARLLAKRILYEARRRTLTEWLGLVDPETSRVHGTFQGIGAWTHRMSHQKPNMANVTNAVRVSDGKESPLGKELRSCWIAPKNRLLVGVDAEAIQLRVFAHLINDPKLIDAIVNGDKKKGTDPHSLNKSYFGSYCKTRNAAKHSLYAMFFGGKGNKIAEIMGCTKAEAEEAIEALVQKYPGLAHLQQEVFPIDARRGYFIGLDGRKVRIPGDTVSQRLHLCMSGYLQNGEKVIMAAATLKFEPELKHYDSFLVDLVHDEWQNECPNNLDVCLKVAELECKALVDVGVELNLNCPLAGSYRNDHNEYTIGNNWYSTH